MISAIARPSSAPVGSSSSVVVPAGRSPVPTLVAMPLVPLVPTLIESEITPTLTPAPLSPVARACGPWWAASPCDRTLPVSVPPGASAASAMPRAGWMERTLSRPAARTRSSAGGGGRARVGGGGPAGHRRVGAVVAGVVDLHADAAQLGGRRRRGAGDVD